jgi:predicted GNAT family acetyltransferase
LKPNIPIKNLQILIQNNMEGFWKQAATTQHLTVNSTTEYTSTVSSIPDALFNSVLSAAFSLDTVNDKISEIKSSYNQKGLSFCWWVSPNSTPKSIENSLTENKFQLYGEVQGMALDIKSADLSLHLPEGITLVAAKSGNDFFSWIKPLAISFHMSEEGAKGYQKIFADLSTISGDIQHYIAFLNNEPVASSTIYYDKDSKVVGIYNCATTPEARNKGIITALTRHSLFAAYNKGYETAVLQASPMSKGLFEEIGFESCSPYKVYLG